MSHKVTTLVYSRKIGSAARKAVLAYMADRASDDGRGVWASKKTIADEIECGRSTVIRVCNEFVAEGVLIVVGSKKCANGATVEYAMNLDVIRAFEAIKKSPKASQSGTSPDLDPSQSGTPPVPERDPKASQSGTQTTSEPSFNQDTNVSLPADTSEKPRKARLPEDWAPSDEDVEYALSQKLNQDEIQEIADDFHVYWTDRTDAGGRKSQRGWRQAWRNRIRDQAPKFIRNRRMAGQAGPGGYGQGRSLASIAARRSLEG